MSEVKRYTAWAAEVALPRGTMVVLAADYDALAARAEALKADFLAAAECNVEQRKTIQRFQTELATERLRADAAVGDANAAEQRAAEWEGLLREARLTLYRAQSVPDDAYDWGVLPGYLIDHCEGHEVTEENLQGWMCEMLADPHYGALFRRENSAASISQRIAEAEQKHGSLRAAAKALGIDPGYLLRLKNAEKTNPSDEVLSALGLERVTFYRQQKESGDE